MIKNSLLKSKQSKSEYGDEMMLGSNKLELQSVEGNRSDHRSDEEEKTDKMEDILKLIAEYRREYGNSVEEYENMRNKIKHDL